MSMYVWGISFHAVVVFGLGKDHLFKSVYADLDTYILCKQKTSRQVLGRSIDSDTAVQNNIQGKLMYLPKYNMHSVTQ